MNMNLVTNVGRPEHDLIKAVSDKEYFGLAPCQITLRKPNAKNPDVYKLVVLCLFFVNIPIIKNRVAK